MIAYEPSSKITPIVAKRPAARRSLAGQVALSRRTETRLRALEKAVEGNRQDLELQFRRIAQIQVELDTLKKKRRATHD